MPGQLSHPEADLHRYLDGELGDEEKRRIEAHLASCAECREQLSFARDFNRGLAQLSAEELTSREPCPNAETLVRYEAREIDDETAEHLRAHMLFCNACRDDYYSLRRLRGPGWTQVVIRAVGAALECLSFSGSGQVLEPSYATVRGETEALSSRIRVEDTVVDPETKATSTIRVAIEAGTKAGTASVLLEAQPSQPEWKVYLFGSEDQELATMPLSLREIAIGSDLPYGSYTVRICRGPDVLANFAIEIRAA